MDTDNNYSERLDNLIVRREKRNPGLSKVRQYKFGKTSALKWDFMIMPNKNELLKNWK